ncbi:hypothetical protein NL676_035584 [Syzygium grande]|nr:hypothetical protein NL676_035584 [Syzygium grande]
MFKERIIEKNPLHLKCLNHISMQCRSVEESIDFYCNVLGFAPIQRPGCFDFDGAWLFNYGIGIHLIKSEDPDRMPKVEQINPKDRHISFQCESMETVEKKLREMKIGYVNGRVVEGGVAVDQLFFHDPNGSMIEVCNCENIPVVVLDNGGDTIRGSSIVNSNNGVERDRQYKFVEQRQPQIHRPVCDTI